MPLPNDYMETLKERSKKSRVYVQFQDVGLSLTDILHDTAHKALYIKLAKENDADELTRLAKRIAEMKAVKNKGAYFMRVWHAEHPKPKKKEKK